MTEEEKKAAEAASTSEANQEVVKTEEELAEEAAKKAEEEAASKDIDYTKELNDLKENEIVPPVKSEGRTEEEKAKFTLDKIHERFPSLKEQPGEGADVNAAVSDMQSTLLRNQVEGIIRQDSKTEEEVKYKMYFYDKRIKHTGNVHTDSSAAVWLANESRTKNAIAEMRRDPGTPKNPGGSGAPADTNAAPDLPADEHKRLVTAGFRKVEPGHYESSMFNLKWDKKARQWDQTKK